MADISAKEYDERLIKLYHKEVRDTIIHSVLLLVVFFGVSQLLSELQLLVKLILLGPCVFIPLIDIKFKVPTLSFGQKASSTPKIIAGVVAIIASSLPVYDLVKFFLSEAGIRVPRWGVLASPVVLGIFILALGGLHIINNPSSSGINLPNEYELSQIKVNQELAGIDPNKMPYIPKDEALRMTVNDWNELATRMEIAGYDIKRDK